METYLAIITTVLVLTQVIRLVQNTISLHRQSKELKKNIEWLKDNEITKADVLIQKDAYLLIRKYLMKKMEEEEEE